jgi:lysine biosynthesis protein LysW
MATCPECDADLVDVDEYEVDMGEIVRCPDCGKNFEVAGTSPLELEEVEEDDDEDDDDDLDEDEEDAADDDEDEDEDDEEDEDWEE